MKKLAIFLVAALLLPFALCGCANKAENTLNVFNWGEYIDDEILDVNRAFEEATGIKVNYKTFDSNESMYTLISTGAADYDVIFPSDYMVGKMIDEGLLAELNFDNIPNYQYIDEKYRNMLYDPENRYSVPYMWGTVGIFYNTKYVSREEVESQGWGILWNKKYKDKIYMFDNPRDAFAVAEAYLGYSLNTTNEGEIRAAYDKLIEQKDLLQGYYMDQIFQKMINEEGWIAPYYAGDGSVMMDPEEGNTDIAFYAPPGTNMFVDAMCVLKSSDMKAEAEAYINFLCSTDAALANTEYIGYSTPHTEAHKKLDPEWASDPMYYPDADFLKTTEVFLTLPDKTNKLMNELWIKLKIH
ncbi:MAG: ABC transporter substrate-binding protein [Ruminococcaceae bacterium]|nr:ABC transporter substrate-binding protein [Oscillospiraceae bacterium]